MRSRHCRDKKHRKHQTHLISKDSHKYCRLLLPVSEDDEASEIKSRRRSKHDHSKAVNAVRFLVHKTRKLDPAFIKSGFFSFNIYVDCQLHLVYCLTTKISILSFVWSPSRSLTQHLSTDEGLEEEEEENKTPRGSRAPSKRASAATSRLSRRSTRVTKSHTNRPSIIKKKQKIHLSH